MNIERLLGWGIAIYAVKHLVWYGLVSYGFVQGAWPTTLLVLLVLTVTVAIAGHELRAVSAVDILPYSLGWAVMMAGLDAVLAIPFGTWEIYSELTVWLGYLIVVVIPLFASHARALSNTVPPVQG